MIFAREHVPTFVERDEPMASNAVATTGELLQLPWVRRWETLGSFCGWHKSRDGRLLLACFDGRPSYLVIAYLSGDQSPDLPIWEEREESLQAGP